MSVKVERAAHLEFNEGFIERMKLLLKSSPGDKDKGIQDLINDENKNKMLRLSFQDEVALMPAEMQCAAFENLTEAQLVEVIISNPRFEPCAGYVLKKRKCRTLYTTLRKRSEYTGMEKVLNLEWFATLVPATADEEEDWEISVERELRFKKKISSLRFAFDWLDVITKYTDVSRTWFTLNECEFGELLDAGIIAPPDEERERTSVDGTRFEYRRNSARPDYGLFLKWFSPTKIYCDKCTPVLFDNHGQIMTAGTEFLCINMYNGGSSLQVDHGNIDDVMEKNLVPKIQIDRGCNWSDKSVKAVLTAHANGEGSVGTRSILCSFRDDHIYLLRMRSQQRMRGHNGTSWKYIPGSHPYERSSQQWRKLYLDWYESHELSYGKPKRNVTYDFVLDTDAQWPTYVFKLSLD